MPLLPATALAKILNFGSNLGAFLLFLAAGKVVWIAGTVMICGQVIGAYLGSLAMISIGAKLIKPMIVIMCFHHDRPLRLAKRSFGRPVLTVRPNMPIGIRTRVIVYRALTVSPRWILLLASSNGCRAKSHAD